MKFYKYNLMLVFCLGIMQYGVSQQRVSLEEAKNAAFYTLKDRAAEQFGMEKTSTIDTVWTLTDEKGNVLMYNIKKGTKL